MQLDSPYLIFIGDAKDPLAAKTGQGIVDWRPERCLAQLRLAGCSADLGIADMTVDQAAAAGARTLVVGTVNPGGVVPQAWVPTLLDALTAGLDIASGMHARLDSFAELADAAVRYGRRLFDVRHNDRSFVPGDGLPRSGKRVLTVGTDCSVGKKYTALAIEREMRARGMKADFRATGQTGILIAGGGVAIDAVVADFISGAAESLSPNADDNHWDVVEGQGSLGHPSFAGVSMGLLHGTQPDAFIVCHEPTRTTMRNVSAPITSISDVIEQTTTHGRLTNPNIDCVGIALNTVELDAQRAQALLDEARNHFNVPACDPMRFGIGAIVDRLSSSYPT
jgi:uncharacterized NAD-dependent epimerase/dehydratase family protein